MKKTLTSIAILTAIVSTTTHAATVFNKDGKTLSVGGRMEFRGDFGGNEDGEKIEGSMQNKSRARLNIEGTTEINDHLDAFGFYEVEHGVISAAEKNQGDNGEKLKQRYMFVGIDSDFGALSFGKQDSAGVMISDISDLGIYTGIQKEFIAAGDEQVNNTVAYSGAFFEEALTLNASVIAGEKAHTDGFGVAAKYDLPFGLGFALGYAQNGNGESHGIKQGTAKQTIAGVSYAIGGLELGGTYTQGDVDDSTSRKFKGTELSAVYSFDSGFSLLAAYQNTEKDKLANTGKEKNDFYEVTGEYEFTANFRTYLALKLNNLKKGENDLARDAEDSARLGIRYDF
jgi:predicted porin